MFVFIADESGPAAMQHGTGSPRVSKSPVATILLGIFLCLALNHQLINAAVSANQKTNKSCFGIKLVEKEIENFER
jgi:hypothetical protein